MQLLFLGTGAADWNINDRRDGMEWRRFSSTLIDGTLLIDPGPHIFDFAEKNNLPHLLDNVRDIIITHSHMDHFNSKNTQRLCSGGRNCRVFGDSADLRKLKRELGEDMTVDFHCVTPGTRFGAGAYDILPVRSNHGTTDPDEITLNYAISHNGQTMYYGLDTGWLPYETWLTIRKLRFDCMVLELTVGEITPGDDRNFSHTSIPMLELMLQTFRRQGCAAPGCKIVVSHLARTLHYDQAITAARLAPLGVEVAYDGLEYKF